jgi:hydroxypyruvate isomerase
MDRRHFVQTTIAAGASLAASGDMQMSAHAQQPQQRKFKLNYAPHPGMFREHAPGGVVAEIEFMAGEGFTALEYNGLKGRPVPEQEAIGAALAKHNMKMGVFVAHTIDWNATILADGNQEKIDLFLKEITESVDVAKRVNAKWMTIVPGRIDQRRDMAFQTARVVETLKRASDILEPHGLVMVMEPLNTRVDHPGQFLTHTAQAYLICKAVDSPSCKILYDMYHQQITEGHLIRNMDAAWDEIAYLQVGDNPGRREPGTGEINYLNVFKHIASKNFTGVIGMEHGNSIRGKDGERAVINAYIAADKF